MSGSLRHPWRVFALLATAAALNAAPIVLPGGISLYLGPFIYMPLVLTLPRTWAILAAAVPMSVTLHLQGDPFSLMLAAAEAAALTVGRKHSRVARDVLFWILAGVPATFALHAGLAREPLDLTAIIAMKQGLNHVAAVAIAVFVLRITQLGQWIDQLDAPQSRMRDMVFHAAFVLAMVPLVLVGLGMSMLLRSYCEREDRAVLVETSQRLSRQLGLFLTTHQASVETLGRMLSRQAGDPATLLEETRRTHPAFLTMLVADASGQLTHTAPTHSLERIPQRQVGDRPYFQKAREADRTYVSGVFRGRGFGRDIIVAISAPVRDASGGFAGVVQASLEVQNFARMIVGDPLDDDVELIFCDAAGRVIYADARTGIAPLANLRHYPQGELLKSPQDGRYATVDRVDPQTGSTRMRAYAATAEGSGVIVIAQRRILAGLEGSGWVFVLFGAVAIGIALAAALVSRSIRRRLADPLEHFAADANRQAELSTVAPIRNPNPDSASEVALVFLAFNQLARQLQFSHKVLRETNEQLDRRVTERTAEAEAARRQAEAASQSKTDFLATTGHEIRTPLNAIIGLAGALLEKTYDPAAAERLRTIRNSGQRLLGVVNDLLDLSRVEAGRLELRPAPVELHELCDEIVMLLGDRARQQGLDLRLDLEPRRPFWVETDGPRLTQVLINLVGNALKFTSRGHVTLRVTREAATPDTVTLRFAVVDTGCGIPTEEQAKLFQPYTQLEGGLTSDTPGSGLGLSISRRLVALFGGTLAVRSTVGAGSDFHFTLRLPLSAPSATVADQPVEPPARSALRVLAVDDNAVNQEVLRSLLEHRCGVLVTVDSAATALAELERESYDVALIDLEMPVADGYYVAQVVRSWHGSQASRGCRLIAISAHSRDQAWPRCQGSGFDDFVEKPLDRQRLLRAVMHEALLAT